LKIYYPAQTHLPLQEAPLGQLAPVQHVVPNAGGNDGGKDGGNDGGKEGGGATGVTLDDAEDAFEDASYEVVATTVKVYDVPFDKPVTVIGETLLLPVMPPGLEVATYVAAPVFPLYEGNVKLTVADPLPADAVTDVGESGVLPPDEEFPSIGLMHLGLQLIPKYLCCV